MNETWWKSANQLRDEQKAIIALSADSSHLLTGPPGSGKTNLLLLRANYLYLAGHKNILILVLTKTLQEFISAGGANYKFPVEKVKTTRKWQLDFLREHNESVDLSGPFDEQRRRIVDKIRSIVELKNLRHVYDTILVDEAQDLLPEEVEIFRKLGRYLFATADTEQKIYTVPDSFPTMQNLVDRQHKLRYHYRVGRNICRLADALQMGNPSHVSLVQECNYDEASRPSSAKLVRAKDFQDQIRLMLPVVSEQVIAYPDELIGVLCPRTDRTFEIWETLRSTELGPISVLQGGGENAPFQTDTQICVSTLHSAKGLEFRAVHVLGCEFLDQNPHSLNLTYTAVTRTKTTLVMYYSHRVPGFLEQAFADLELEHELPPLDSVFGN